MRSKARTEQERCGKAAVGGGVCGERARAVRAGGAQALGGGGDGDGRGGVRSTRWRRAGGQQLPRSLLQHAGDDGRVARRVCGAE